MLHVIEVLLVTLVDDLAVLVKVLSHLLLPRLELAHLLADRHLAFFKRLLP